MGEKEEGEEGDNLFGISISLFLFLSPLSGTAAPHLYHYG